MDDGVLQLVVVVAAPERSTPEDAPVVRRAAKERGFEVVTNDDPEAGLSRSLQVGLGALEPTGIDAVLVLLADQPRTRSDVLRAVVAEWRRTGARIVVPRYRAAGGAPGNPVLLARAVWRLAEALKGDTGMSGITRRRPALVAHVDVEGANPDVDRREDLAALQRDVPG